MSGKEKVVDIVQASDLKIWSVEPELDEVEAGEAFLGGFFKSAKRFLQGDFWVLTPVGLFHSKEKIGKFSKTFQNADFDFLYNDVKEKITSFGRVKIRFWGSKEIFDFVKKICDELGVECESVF